MWKIGLTGSIATGKSTVLKVFVSHGVPVFSADAAVHELYSGAGVPVVEALFPGVARDGVVDRAELSRRIVAEPQKLRELEAVVHPMVRSRMGTFLAEAETAGAVLAVIDIPLLFETGFDYGLDRVAVTLAPDDVVRRRALARPGMSVGKLNAILARQMPQGDKRQRADYIIDTSGPLSRTEAAVEALIAALEASPEGIE